MTARNVRRVYSPVDRYKFHQWGSLHIRTDIREFDKDYGLQMNAMTGIWTGPHIRRAFIMATFLLV
uniref:Uncharacterized protein n=1 Tax=Meloidogyne incognita TaxID=6306 RepID=A0A914MC63_MELIC